MSKNGFTIVSRQHEWVGLNHIELLVECRLENTSHAAQEMLIELVNKAVQEFYEKYAGIKNAQGVIHKNPVELLIPPTANSPALTIPLSPAPNADKPEWIPEVFV